MNLIRRFFNWLSDDGSGRGVCYYNGLYGNGRAYYEYIEMGGMRVYEGVFKYSHKYVANSGIEGKTKTRGRYSDNKKTGRWFYERHEAGKLCRLWVDYANGEPVGRYRYVERERKGLLGTGKVTNRLDALLDRGRMTGMVSGLLGGFAFVGHFDGVGRPDGQWKLEAGIKHNCESWHNGVLVESYVVDMSTGNRKNVGSTITKMLDTLVYYDCVPLERIGQQPRRHGKEELAGMNICRLLRGEWHELL